MQAIVGSAIPRQMSLTWTKKRAEQVRESQPLSSVPLWLLLWSLSPGSFLEFLPLLPIAMVCDLGAIRRNTNFLLWLVLCPEYFIKTIDR